MGRTLGLGVPLLTGGLQIQRQAGEVITRFKTVQGVLEEHLHKLKRVDEVIVKTSSRTDSNVHGLMNACQVDLVHRWPQLEFNPQWLTSTLNRTLTKGNEKLRILNTLRVPEDFSCRRQAAERTYVYRMAVVKEPLETSGLPWTAQDADFASLVYPPFDMDLFLKAAEMLSGTHNFLSFSTRGFLNTGREERPDACMDIRVERGKGWMEDERPEVAGVIDHWDVHFCSQSFLYKQLRRMMGAMVMVAQGKMSLATIQHCLDHPSVENPGRIQGLPGRGLTLKRVCYPDHELTFSPEELGMGIAAEEKEGEVEKESTDDQEHLDGDDAKETVLQSSTNTTTTSSTSPVTAQDASLSEQCSVPS